MGVVTREREERVAVKVLGWTEEALRDPEKAA